MIQTQLPPIYASNAYQVVNYVYLIQIVLNVLKITVLQPILPVNFYLYANHVEIKIQLNNFLKNKSNIVIL